jgi:uncharacterized protein (DUF488 family)
MSEFSAPARQCLYTIGHSNHALEIFLGLLHQHAIEVLVDVRSQPYSRYTPHFTGATLKSAIQKAGLRYLYLGKELGGRPDDDSFYDDRGRVRYDLVALSLSFKEGIERLLSGIARYRVALLCAEEDPSGCHRRLLVGRVLTDQHGIEVIHIRGDGSVQSEPDLREDEMRRHAGAQLTLFNTPADDDTAWTSVLAVRPARA